jgi:hypothetical protein
MITWPTKRVRDSENSAGNLKNQGLNAARSARFLKASVQIYRKGYCRFNMRNDERQPPQSKGKQMPEMLEAMVSY